MKRAIVRLCVIAVLVGLAVTISLAQEPVIWQLGKPDGSGAEFGVFGHWDRYKQDTPGGLVTYHAGQSDPAKNTANNPQARGPAMNRRAEITKPDESG